MKRVIHKNQNEALRKSGSFKANDNRSEQEKELIRLRKLNQELLMENDILKQAALIMGRKQK